jgi:hypothetical protein
MVAAGMNNEEILAAFPDLEPADIREALVYAAEAVRERELPLVQTLPAVVQALEQGSIVIIEQERLRIRSLPIVAPE